MKASSENSPAFYELSKAARAELTLSMHKVIESDLRSGEITNIQKYFSNPDTYIRKAAYIATGRIFTSHEPLRKKILETLTALSANPDAKVRQTAVNAAGEIGIKDFETVELFFDRGLFDEHHSVRNAVIGSIKKMGEKNPGPVLGWAKKYLHHPDKEVRREICHGIELRGRKHPEDILPLLKELQSDKTARVRNTLVHVLGQISYKKGCLEKTGLHLKSWENKELVKDAVAEIIDVHKRYSAFAVKSVEEAERYLRSVGLC